MAETDLASRLERLETAIAYQDQVIEDLNAALAEHYKQIESLKRELHNLGSALRDVEAHPALAGREPPPPHY
jgi:SlyX protein